MSQTLKPWREYFNAAQPFDATNPDRLLDALEQALAMCAEYELFGARWLIGIERTDAGVRVVINTPGEDNQFTGGTLREALDNTFNDRDERAR